jgi:hypothetical protein
VAGAGAKTGVEGDDAFAGFKDADPPRIDKLRWLDEATFRIRIAGLSGGGENPAWCVHVAKPVAAL